MNRLTEEEKTMLESVYDCIRDSYTENKDHIRINNIRLIYEYKNYMAYKTSVNDFFPSKKDLVHFVEKHIKSIGGDEIIKITIDSSEWEQKTDYSVRIQFKRGKYPENAFEIERAKKEYKVIKKQGRLVENGW